jgi:hypothetical protein
VTVAGGILIMRKRTLNRAPGFDYSPRGACLLATNVKHRAEWFGRVKIDSSFRFAVVSMAAVVPRYRYPLSSRDAWYSAV